MPPKKFTIFRPAVLLDTSALRSISWTSAPFQGLMDLSKSDLIDVFLPEIAYQESRTQWRERRAKGVEDARKGIEKLLSDPLLPQPHRSSVSEIAVALGVLPDIDQISIDAFEGFVEENHLTRLPLEKSQGDSAWEAYFSGKPPFKQAKNRNDIPDAFVFAAAVELLNRRDPVHCVCKDGALADALGSLPKAIVHESIADLMQSAPLIEVRADWALEKTWQALAPNISSERIANEVRRFIEESGGDNLSYKEVRGGQIPEDNHTANIQMHGEAEEIEIGIPEEWGGGLLSIPVSYEVDVSIYFNVFRSDAYDVPDWVSVSYGDPETDHYFEAEGEVRVRVDTRLSGHVDLGAVDDPGASLFSSLAFDDNSEAIEIIDPPEDG